jgi:hypothetical protein
MNETCGCCEGLEPLTPLATANRPGLNALAYRAGTHATFLATMKARLSASKYPALAGLTTRTATDPAIALLDAWATVADVFTFYQERIANEGYLRTATERRSILELARLVGFALRPGVAASVYLAFTMDDGHNLEIPIGTRAQSLPGPGELPQSFETAEKLEARAAWNALTPRRSQPQSLQQLAETKRLHLKGIATNVGPNDPLLIDFGGQCQAFLRVETVKPDPVADRTLVTLQPLVASGEPSDLVDEIRRRVEPYFDLEAYGVSPGTMTGRVEGLLQEWQASLTPGTPFERLATLLRERYLPRLQQEQASARGGGYTRLTPWISGIVDELQEIEKQLHSGCSEPAVADALNALAAATAPAEPPAGNGEPPLAKLEELLGPLAKPPSAQPANALKLLRSLEQSFAPASDAVPRLLVALRPDLRHTLYQAWEQTGAEPSAVRVYALRTTASPFGHNAPLRPILGEKGTIERYEEWTLERTTQVIEQPLEVNIAVRPVIEGPALIRIDVTLEDETRRRGPQSLADGRFRLAFTQARETVAGTISDVEGDRFSLTLAFRNSGAVVQIRDRVDGGVVIEASRAEAAPTTRITVDIRENDEFEVTSTGSDPTNVTLDRDERQNRRIVVNGEIRGRSTEPTEQPNVVSLDTSYKQILPDKQIPPRSWIVLERPNANAAGSIPQTLITQVEKVSEGSRADYGITAKGTQVTLRQDWLYLPANREDPQRDTFAVIRGTSVHAQSELLELAEAPLEEIDKGEVTVKPVCGNRIELDALYDGLESGRWLIVSGERQDEDLPVPGVTASELVMLAGVEQEFDTNLPDDKIHSTLILANDLAYCYKRETATIYGNVARATHGETHTEVLGSGDASKALQHFSLKQTPLTYVAATTPTGTESTLKAYVNDIRWHEAERLTGLKPTDRRFITRTDDQDETTLVFGDGERGARLPTGMENVRAVYRTGIGKAGNVAAEQISQLASRPLGLKGVINPLPATGGADRETRDQARRNAPLAVMALDRLVSVQDYEDFARTFAGIGKASSARLSDGHRQLVHLTVAGVDDIPIAKDSDLYRNLVQALQQFGDPHQPLRVEVRELILLIISARVRVLPDYLWESVEPNIRATLLDTFGFERRDLGQDVLLSEVISTIQRVPGVAYVDVDAFGGVPEKTTDATTGERRFLTPTEIAARIQSLGLNPRVPVELAGGLQEAAIRPAQLAFLTPNVPDTLILTEVTA